MTEEAIESVVADYVRYDIDELEIAFTPDFAGLGSKAKILVYLVSLKGWPFVTDDDVPTGAKPADISEMLGIAGGTVRRILVELKDSHLVSVKNSRYSVRPSHLDSVKKAITGAGQANKPGNRHKKSAEKKSAKKAKPKTSKKTSNKKNKGLGETIDKWIAQGFLTTGVPRPRFETDFTRRQ